MFALQEEGKLPHGACSRSLPDVLRAVRACAELAAYRQRVIKHQIIKEFLIVCRPERDVLHVRLRPRCSFWQTCSMVSNSSLALEHCGKCLLLNFPNEHPALHHARS